MKKTKIITLLALAGLGTSVYAADSDKKADSGPNLSPEGYWVQFDEDEDAGRGMPEGIIHTYVVNKDTKNSRGKNGTLQMEIAVPLMEVRDGKPSKPGLTCHSCKNGSYNGFTYKGKNAALQGLIFAGNMQKQSGTGVKGQKSDVYKNGGVLNPNDGKVYASEAQVRDGGDTMYAKAAYIVWGKEIGSKDAHWKRISKADYKAIKADCGVTSKGAYANNNSEITAKCVNYPVGQFGVKSPV